MATQNSVPRSIRDLTPLERQLERRVLYFRPPALRGVEWVGLTIWGDLLPGAYEDRVQLSLVDSSRSTIRCGGQDYAASNGMVGVTAPGVMPRVVRRDSAFTRVRSLLVDAKLARKLTRSGRSSRPTRARDYMMGHHEGLQRSLGSLLAFIDEGAPALAQQTALVACLCAAGEGLGALGAVSDVAIPSRVERARALLHARFEQDISLEELTLAAGGDIHPRYLLSSFTRALGVAPHQYQLRLRIAKARQLLAHGMTATATAQAVGFFDAPQLHRHFVRSVGMSPGAYAIALR